MTQVIEDYKPSAREALDQHRWADAYLILKEADDAGLLPAEDLESFSEASWWNGKHDESLEVRERAFNAYIAEDKPAKAAEMAVFLSREFGQKGEEAKAGAWFARAERLLSGLEECEEHGYLYMGRAMAYAFRGQWEEAIPEAKRALDIGNRYLNKDIQAFAICIEGMALVNSGDVKKGLNLIDEAAVAAVSGELRPFSTGFLYCMAISQSRDLADYRRAGEWTEAAKRWCERQSINGFPGVCRVHKAEILALRGNWAEAEQEARKASDELMNFNLGFIASNGFYEIGEIRLRMGDLPAAEDAFMQAHQMGRNPEPGMTMLRVVQGNYGAAATSIKRALLEEMNPLMRARLLPVHVEIAIEQCNFDEARTAVEESEEIASKFESPALHAASYFVRGALQLAEGSPQDAIRTLRQSLAVWQEVEVPFEAAKCRVLLGKAYRELGDEEGAMLEFQAAKNAFQKLGAGVESKKVLELIGSDESEHAAFQTSGERVTKTFMFTDIVGSTNLLEAIGDEAWENLIEWHDKTLRSVIAEHAGEEIRSQGDGFAVAFSDPTNAIDCAVHIQRALAEHRKKAGFSPQVRIGLHISEITRRGLDYAGKGIHEAARIGAMATGGQILVSRSTLDASRSNCRTSEPMSVTLKGIAEPVQVLPIEWR